MRISIPAAATACLAVALAGACRTRSRHSTDLLAQSWRAEVNFERVGKSLLTDDGDPNMVSGWVGEEMTPTGRLIWAIGPESSLRFHLNSPRALRLKLSATAYEPALAGKSQNMEIQLNHHSIGKMTFSADTASNLTLELPAELLQMGSNELRLLHPWSARPGEATIKDDMRPLSVGFTQLDLMELDETQRPDAQSLKPDWSGAWYDPETDPDIGAFRWAPTEGTALLFNSMPGVTGYRLSCQLLPYQPKGAPPQFVEFRLNGVLMERRRLAPGWQTVAISLLNDKLRPGLNVIDLKAEHGLSPLAAGEGKDTRVLAFALGARLLTPLSHTSFPSGRLFTHPQGGLSLPTTARLAYTMELLAGASFEVEGDAEMPALIQLSCRCNTDHEARHEAVKVQGHFLRSMKACSAPGLAEVSVSANAIQGTPPVHLSRFNLYTRETPLLWAEQPPRPPVAPVTKRPKTIIISLVDTLRADRLSVYGYSRATSPALAAFAREATVFDNAWSTTSWTKSAVASLLTGADPDIHSAGEALSTLNSRVPYLPALFKPAGYHSAAVITSGYVGPEFGFARDWDEFHYLPSADGPEPSSVVANRMLARILETAGDAPLLITCIPWIRIFPTKPGLVISHRLRPPLQPISV